MPTRFNAQRYAHQEHSASACMKIIAPPRLARVQNKLSPVAQPRGLRTSRAFSKVLCTRQPKDNCSAMHTTARAACFERAMHWTDGLGLPTCLTLGGSAHPTRLRARVSCCKLFLIGICALLSATVTQSKSKDLLVEAGVRCEALPSKLAGALL